jgi:hypothetical protein
VWSHNSDDANLPVLSVLGGQADSDRDKVGDTDPVNLLYAFVSLANALQFSF